MTESELASVVRGIAPVIRMQVEKQAAKQLLWLQQQVNELEKRVANVRDGHDGVDGKDGLDGQAGPVGPSGDKGDTGPAGATGDVGPEGSQGDAGPQGPQGPAGQSGEKGLEGEPGRDGRDGQPGVPGQTGEKGLDGRNGVDGVNGADGLGFDDLEAVHDEYGRLSLRFVRGEIVKTFRVPSFVDRGAFKSGESYEPGDAVTFGGALWIAQSVTSAKPGEIGQESRAWRLAVKPGRDGRDRRPNA